MSTYYKDGRQAFADGVAWTDNPYNMGSEAHDHWSGGWLDAKTDSKATRSETTDIFEDDDWALDPNMGAQG